jgi:hypothetical protein
MQSSSSASATSVTAWPGGSFLQLTQSVLTVLMKPAPSWTHSGCAVFQPLQAALLGKHLLMNSQPGTAPQTRTLSACRTMQ